MIRRSKALLLGAAALGLLAGLSPKASADFNASSGGSGSLAGISWSDFTSAGFTAVTPQLVQSYGTTPSGNAVSQVYQNGSTYAYLYQLQVAPGSDVGSYQLDWKSSAFASSPVTIGGNPAGPVYAITGLGSASSSSTGAFSLSGTIETPTSITGTNLNRLQAFFPGTSNADTAVVVVFSTTHPGAVVARSISDGGSATVLPEVYAPAPEPSALALWGLGGIGLAAGAAFRRFRFPPIKPA